MKPETGSSASFASLAALAASAFLVSAAWAASWAAAAASSLDFALALAASSCLCSSSTFAAAFCFWSSARPLACAVLAAAPAFSATAGPAPTHAVRSCLSGARPAVPRDAVQGDAQHVRHPGIVIEARAMVLVLLHDAEDAGWRLASRSSARHRRTQDPAVGVVDGHLLALDRYDRHDRLARDARGRPLGGLLGTGLAGRGVGGQSRSQRRQDGRSRERHNRGRCPSPGYLGGLGRRASICHAMPPSPNAHFPIC